MHDVIDDSALVRITNSSVRHQELKAVSAWNCEERLGWVGTRVHTCSKEGEGEGEGERCVHTYLSHAPPSLHVLCSVTLEGLMMVDMSQLVRKGIKAETLVCIQLSLYYGGKCIRGNQLTTPKKLGPLGTVIWNERLWIAPNIKIKDLPKVCVACARTAQTEELLNVQTMYVCICTYSRRKLHRCKEEGECLQRFPPSNPPSTVPSTAGVQGHR